MCKSTPSAFVSLEIVALRQIAHERDLDAALVERRRRALDSVRQGAACHGSGNEEAEKAGLEMSHDANS
jgi:hypothetical protein